MAGRKNKKDTKLAHKPTSIFIAIKQVFENIGKPFYKLLSFIVIFFLFILHIISRISKVSLPKISFPKFFPLKIKIKFPLLSSRKILEKIVVFLKLLFLFFALSVL